MPVSPDDRLLNLESNYSRLADSLHRIGHEMAEQGKDLKKVIRMILGEYDEDENKYRGGLCQRTESLESAHLKSQANKMGAWKRFAVTAANIAGIVIGAKILEHWK